MAYKQALVFFLDILGSQGRENFHELYLINSIFHNEMEKNQRNDKQYTAYQRNIYTFSDCAYIIYDFKDIIDDSKKDLRKLFNIALYNTEVLIQKFLANNFLCRGGATYGEVYYEKERSLFFGPAVNKAHKYEEKIANYPRVIIDEYIAEQVISLNNEIIQNAPNKMVRQQVVETNGNIVIKDRTDGQYILNYFNSIKLGHNYIYNQQLIHSLTNLINKEIKMQEVKIEKDINNKNNYVNIINKYIWLRDYLEESKPSKSSGQNLLTTSNQVEYY